MSMTEPWAEALRTPLPNDAPPKAPLSDDPAPGRAPEGGAPPTRVATDRAPAFEPAPPGPAEVTPVRVVLWHWVLFLGGTSGLFAAAAWLL